MHEDTGPSQHVPKEGPLHLLADSVNNYAYHTSSTNDSLKNPPKQEPPRVISEHEQLISHHQKFDKEKDWTR